MTSSAMLLTGLVFFLAAFVALSAYATYAKKQLERLRALDRWSAKFVAEVEAMANNPRVPLRLLRQFNSINACIGRPEAAKALCRALAAPNVDDAPDLSLPSIDDDVKRQAVATYITGFLAISYSSLWSGLRARAVLAEHMKAMTDNPSATVSAARQMKFAPASRGFTIHGPKAA